MIPRRNAEAYSEAEYLALKRAGKLAAVSSVTASYVQKLARKYGNKKAPRLTAEEWSLLINLSAGDLAHG